MAQTCKLNAEEYKEYISSLETIGNALASAFSNNPNCFVFDDSSDDEDYSDRMVQGHIPTTNDSYLSIVQDQDTIIPFESTTEPRIQLTDQEVYDLLEEMETWSINMEGWDDENHDDHYWDLWQKLKTLTYDENYISNFTWEKTEDIHQMAREKLLSYWKFGEEI